MVVNSYSELSALGKIVYSRYRAGTITTAQVNQFVSLGKITQDEADFILASV